MPEKVDFDKVIQLQSQFPDFIKVKINKSEDGGYWVKVLNLRGCFTQVDDFKDLLTMVNDAVYTYFDTPENYKIEMPRYFPAEKIRRALQQWQKNIPFNIFQTPIIFFPQGISRTSP